MRPPNGYTAKQAAEVEVMEAAKRAYYRHYLSLTPAQERDMRRHIAKIANRMERALVKRGFILDTGLPQLDEECEARDRNHT